MDPLRIAAASPEGRRPEEARPSPEVALDHVTNKSLIQGLPNELLIAIFDLIRDAGEISLRIEMLKTLSCVCLRWRELVIQTSSLWTRLDSTASQDTWSLVLRRNPTGQLDFTFRGEQESYRHLRLISFLKNETWRIRSVQLDAGQSSKILPSLLQRTTSSLRFLSLITRRATLRRAWNGIQIPNLSDGPTFLHLSLQDVHLPWNHPRLADLRLLNLFCVREVLPLPEDMHRILSLSPLLEELRLGKKWYSPIPTEPDRVLIDRMQAYPPIILNHLHRIVLQDVLQPLFILLLSTIRCSSCREIVLYPCRGDDVSTMALALAASAIKLLPELNITKHEDCSIYVTKESSSGKAAGGASFKVKLYFLDVDTAAYEQRIESLLEGGVLVHQESQSSMAVES